MTRPLPTVGAVLVAVVAGMAFAPVFGFGALLLPVLVPAAAVAVCYLLPLRDWRALVAVVAGALSSTAVLGAPPSDTVDALAAGVTDSWRLALESTWPARPEPALMMFVPLLVVLAAVLGAEMVRRLAARLPALLPSLAMLVLAQLYAALPPGAAGLAALAYAAAACAVLITAGPLRPPLVTGTAIVAAAALATLLVPAGPASYSLREARAAPVPQGQLTNPLDEIAYRLDHPGTAAFRVSAAADRWPLVVFDRFDGASWTQAGSYRRLGAELPPGPAVTVPVRRRTARIDASRAGLPWLPSQAWPASVSGAAPLVAERYGTLLLPSGTAASRYTLDWWEPTIAAGDLADAPVDPAAPGGLGGVGDAPDSATRLAAEATRGLRPSMRAALVLEDWFRRGYRLAAGQSLPTGNGWPQLVDFLLTGKRGTSEQFAAAYVALARIRGIPARLAVGFRTPPTADPDGWYTVRNGDVLAWPEVAVRGAGWVPLDPTGSAARSAVDTAGVAARVEQARSQLPPPQDLRDPPVAPARRATNAAAVADRFSVPWLVLLALVLVPLLAWPIAVPATWAARSRWRRRRSGPDAVTGAWHEARDRLRAHGVPVTPAMTVRDLSTAAAAVTDRETTDAIGTLGSIVDRALWSAGPDDRDAAQAWAAVRAVRRGLARRGPRARLRAALDPTGLRPPGARGAAVSARRSRRGSAAAG